MWASAKEGDDDTESQSVKSKANGLNHGPTTTSKPMPASMNSDRHRRAIAPEYEPGVIPEAATGWRWRDRPCVHLRHSFTAWVEPAVNDVDEKIEHDDQDAVENDDAHDERVVPIQARPARNTGRDRAR